MQGSDILRGILIVIEILSAFFLIVLILMQKSKNQGMGLAFGGQMGETLFGAQMGNVLTKATVILAVVFLVNTTVLAMLGPSGGKKSIADTIPAGPAAGQPSAQPIQQEGAPIEAPPVQDDGPMIPPVVPGAEPVE